MLVGITAPGFLINSKLGFLLISLRMLRRLPNQIRSLFISWLLGLARFLSLRLNIPIVNLLIPRLDWSVAAAVTDPHCPAAIRVVFHLEEMLKPEKSKPRKNQQ